MVAQQDSMRNTSRGSKRIQQTPATITKIYYTEALLGAASLIPTRLRVLFMKEVIVYSMILSAIFPGRHLE